MRNAGLRHRKISRLKQIVITVFVASVLIPSAADAAVPSDEEVRKKVKSTRPYEIAREIEFELAEEEAIQLTIGANPYGFKECIVFPSNDGQIWSIFFDTYGERTNYSWSYNLKGALIQWSEAPAAEIIKWDIKNDTIKFRFCISLDKERITREYEKMKAGKVEMATGFRNYAIIQPPELTELERLTGFIKLWSEVKYNFAFFDQVPDLNWDAVLEEYLPRVQQAETTFEYFRLLKQCVAMLQDGHTSLWGPSNEPLYHPPFRIEPVDGKAVIVEIYPAENIKNPEIRKGLLKADLKVGEEITHIDGRAVKQILEQDIYPYIFASTAQWRDLMAYPKLLNGEYSTKAILRIRGVNGTVREVGLTRAAYRFPHKREFVFHELDGGIVYVNVPGFGSDAIVDDFDAVFDKISKAKGLILDMRENGGGNSAFGDRIISYLTDKPIEGTRWKTRQYMPAFRAWGEQEKWYQADRQIIEPRKEGSFAGPIVILTGPATFSAAEDFVVPLHASGRATVVGEKTGGSTGQPLIIELPGDGGARICTKRDAYPDGREFVGVGIIPDVEVHPTPADIAADHDVVLEEGIKVLKSKLM